MLQSLKDVQMVLLGGEVKEQEKKQMNVLTLNVHMEVPTFTSELWKGSSVPERPLTMKK